MIHFAATPSPTSMLRTWSVVLCSVALTGCASLGMAPAGTTAEVPLAVEVHVGGLRADEQAALKDTLCTLRGVETCDFKKEAREAVYTLHYRGSLHVLQREIAAIPHPGLTAQDVKPPCVFRASTTSRRR